MESGLLLVGRKRNASAVAEIARVSVTDALAYWTVLSGPGLDVVSDVDDYLRHLRFGRSRAESTVKTYAGHLKRFHLWCQDQDLSWSKAAHELARYVLHLRNTPEAAQDWAGDIITILREPANPGYPRPRSELTPAQGTPRMDTCVGWSGVH
jgi:hypothetical protein